MIAEMHLSLKMVFQTKPQFMSGWLRIPCATSKKAMWSCTAQCKMV